MPGNCEICEWIEAYRCKDLSPMERRGLVDLETDHPQRIHVDGKGKAV